MTRKTIQAYDPLTIDLSKSIGYQLYYIPRIWNDSSAEYPYAEKFYSLHRRSIRCQIYEKRHMNLSQ